jgi:hypothetical protein
LGCLRGLLKVSTADAAAYLDARQAERPWLAAARDRSPEVQRLFAALDQGRGHAHIRHEGWVTEEMSRRRVAHLDYADGSDERFLRRVWRDLYGDEPVGGA